MQLDTIQDSADELRNEQNGQKDTLVVVELLFLKPVFVHDDEVPGQNKRHGQQNIAFFFALPQSQSFFVY